MLALEVSIPAYLADRLAGREGKPITLHTRFTLETQSQGASFTPRLAGFATRAERDFFELFTTVRGLGGKRALRAMAVEPGEIAMAIEARDTKALQKLPEIGKRLAETIIAELHGKVRGYLDAAVLEAGLSGEVAMKPVRTGPAQDAVAALVALGQQPADAEKLVARAVAARGSDESLTADELVALALHGG